MTIDLPLMSNNIIREDLDKVIEFLSGDPILTQSSNVRAFEQEWAEWLGVKYSVFVNSGASANLATITALRHLYGPGEVLVPSLTWVSDISSVLVNGLKPVFVDVNPANLAMNEQELLRKITPDTRAVFLTHVLGFNGLSEHLLGELQERKIPLIEDVCESIGATFNGKKLGAYGLASNFSFYYAHHMSTIEGGMISTNDPDLYEMVRMLRSHGMVRETAFAATKERYHRDYPDLNPDFIFAYPGFNIRSSEINAVIGRNQLKRLDANNGKRVENFQVFLEHLDSVKYRTDFACAGSVNYAFTLILREKNAERWQRIEQALRAAKVEFRRGTAGGGNQLRQPYLQALLPDGEYRNYPEVDHIHFFGCYIGNYPDLEREKILALCDLLNGIE